MAWVAVDRDESEYIYVEKPIRMTTIYVFGIEKGNFVKVPKGSVKKLIGYDLSWNDDPVELTD